MRSEMFSGRYLFHLHTVNTDGKLLISDYFEWVAQKSIDRLIFLEHIRKQPNYDVDQFVADIKNASERYGIPAIVGFEAKVLPGGELDISTDNFNKADVIGIAEHGFPDDRELWINSLKNAFKKYNGLKFPNKNIVWVHPGLWLKKKRLITKEAAIYEELLLEAIKNSIFVERNYRYDLMPIDYIDLFDSESVIYGADAHQMKDLERWENNLKDEKS